MSTYKDLFLFSCFIGVSLLPKSTHGWNGMDRLEFVWFSGWNITSFKSNRWGRTKPRIIVPHQWHGIKKLAILLLVEHWKLKFFSWLYKYEWHLFHIIQVYRHIKNACKESVGLPLAVQIVGRRYNEELILRLMKELEPIVNFDRM